MSSPRGGDLDGGDPSGGDLSGGGASGGDRSGAETSGGDLGGGGTRRTAQWAAHVAGVRASHERLLREVAALPPGAARRDSRLPGWTVGHVLTHLARNADSHAGILEGASRSEVVAQYPGGPAQRLADIEAGAGRDLDALLADLRSSIARLEAAYATTQPSAWETGRALLGAGERPLGELPFRRWREVEVHRVDLGTGASPASWPRAYVIAELAHQVESLRTRLEPGSRLVLRTTDTGQGWEATAGRVAPLPGPIGLPDPLGEPHVNGVEAPAAELVAWLLGRLVLPGAPEIATWETRPKGAAR